MGKIYQIQVIGFKGERKTIDVAHSEEEFNNTTVDAFKEKLTEKFSELKGNCGLIYFVNVHFYMLIKLVNLSLSVSLRA